MQNDDAMRRARECFGRNLEWYDGDPREDVVPAIVRAIREAVADEREACAKLMETDEGGYFDWTPANAAEAIRARGEA